MSTKKYFKDIKLGISTTLGGMKATMKHFLIGARRRRIPMGIDNPDYFKQPDGLVTIHYPKEKVPVPDTGRYRLHNEIDDCIGCKACARDCPVDCITIETISAVEDLGTTSDGTKKKLWLAVYDIDMAKCCYCGLCTAACPTECLTMTKVYDFAEYDRDNLLYHFGNLTPQQAAEKRKQLEESKKNKNTAKAETTTTVTEEKKEETVQQNTQTAGGRKKPIMKR